MRGCERLWVRRQPWKAAAKERMGGVDDLNVSQGVLCQRTWVVERGMNHTPSDYVVDHWLSDVASSSPRDFLLLYPM